MSEFNSSIGFTPRKLRVACIGSGFAGLTFIHKATTESKYREVVELVAYEKNSSVGGTWLENIYPGAACDIASHSYYLSFAPNPFWSKVFAERDEIAKYFEDASNSFDLKKYIQFDSKVIEAIWNEDLGKWKLKIDHNGTIKEDEVDFLVPANGWLNTPQWPDIPGMDKFEGKILHTATWDQAYDYKGKNVAVIGNGASGIQVFAAMQPDVASITNYSRSPTWFSPPLSAEKSGQDTSCYSKEETREWSEDPAKFKAYLKHVETENNNVFNFFIKNGAASDTLREGCRTMMEEHLDKETAAKLMPDFPPGCRRVTPGIKYMKALKQPNANINFNKITSFTPTGIETADGQKQDYDLIVCATGFDRSFIPTWKMIGRDGIDLRKQWSEADPQAFKSVWVENMPNVGWIYSAPRSPTATGSIPRAMGFVSDNLLRWVRKMSLERIKSMVVRPEVVKEYNEYQDILLEKTVFSSPCKSGYKNERGTITGQYGGSITSFILLLEDLHAECFDLKFMSSNRFAYLGNGWTKYDTSDPTWYMNSE